MCPLCFEKGKNTAARRPTPKPWSSTAPCATDYQPRLCPGWLLLLDLLTKSSSSSWSVFPLPEGLPTPRQNPRSPAAFNGVSPGFSEPAPQISQPESKPWSRFQHPGLGQPGVPRACAVSTAPELGRVGGGGSGNQRRPLRRGAGRARPGF